MVQTPTLKQQQQCPRKIRNEQRKVGPNYKEEMGMETSLYEEQNPHFVATKGTTHE